MFILGIIIPSDYWIKTMVSCQFTLKPIHWYGGFLKRKDTPKSSIFDWVFSFWTIHLGGTSICGSPHFGNVIIPSDFHIFQRGGSIANQADSRWILAIFGICKFHGLLLGDLPASAFGNSIRVERICLPIRCFNPFNAKIQMRKLIYQTQTQFWLNSVHVSFRIGWRKTPWFPVDLP